MFCPECGSEYRAGFMSCSDCGLALVPALSPEEVEGIHGAEEVTVFVTRDIVEVETVKELLEAGGVEVYVAGESSPLPGIPSEMRLVVPQNQADLANELIEGAQEDPDTAATRSLTSERGKVVPFRLNGTTGRAE